MHIVQGPPDALGVSALSDAAGNIYAVGITSSPTTFTTTPGALRATRTGPTVFVRKFSPDGSRVLYSALIGEVYNPDRYERRVVGRVDDTGNVYLTFESRGAIAGAPRWPDGSDECIRCQVFLKIVPDGTRLVYTTGTAVGASGNTAFSIGSDGAAYFAYIDDPTIRILKIDQAGVVMPWSEAITDTPPPGRRTYSGTIDLAVAPDHSVYVSAGPTTVYHVDAEGKRLLFRVAIGGEQLRHDVLSFGTPPLETNAIAVDKSGNCYVAGVTQVPEGIVPFPATPVDFTTALSLSPHAFMIKMDPAGTIIYSSVFATYGFTALAVEADGSAWAAGGTTAGFTVLSVDPSGTGIRKYVSLPSFSARPAYYSLNNVASVAVDSHGRALIAVSTTSRDVPDTRPVGDDASLPSNALFARVLAEPPQADLQMTVTTSPAVTAVLDIVTILITVANRGTAPANDVMLRYSDIASNYIRKGLAQPNVPPPVRSCRTSGHGFCSVEDGFRAGWPAIAPGAEEVLELKVDWNGISPALPYVVALAATTSTNDPAQLDNNTYIRLPFDERTRLHIMGVPADLEVHVNDRSYPAGFNMSSVDPGIPIAAGRDIGIYIPTPQLVGRPVAPYLFQGWSDGSTANPRIFTTASGELTIYPVVKKVTDPWVHPDRPVVNGGSFRGGPIAPGEIVILAGFGLGPPNLIQAQPDATGRIAKSLAGLEVFFDGVAAPVIYASAAQAAVVVPYSVAGKPFVPMSIRYNSIASQEVHVTVADTAPGLFSGNASGAGQLAALNEDGSLNTRDNPASRGYIVVLYGTGEGELDPPSEDGAVAGAIPGKPRRPVAVTIGNVPAQVVYAGGSPGQIAGLLQLNVRVPRDVLPGLLPVVFTIGERSSQRGGTIAVR